MRNSGYLIGIAVAVTLSGVTILTLRSRLRRVLNELCGTPDRGAFWSTLTSVLLVLTPTAFVLLPEYEEASPADDALVALKWALFGLILSLVTLAIVVGQFAAVDARTTKRP